MCAVYLDHNATTPLDPRVRAAMLPWLGERWGNPSSLHSFGQAARNAVEEAREKVAALLGARPPEVVFTASGTEANNAVVAAAGRRAGHRGHLLVSAMEHPSTAAAAAREEELGMEVTRVPPAEDTVGRAPDEASEDASEDTPENSLGGVVSAAAMAAGLRPDTRLACLILAQNELGTLQPVAEVAAACRERGIPLLCDAVQAVGKIPVDAAALGADYLVLGGHKFHGPLGAAALWVRAGAELEPLLVGGSQERRRRAGTENVPAIAGLGEAAAIAAAEIAARRAHLAALRDRFEAGVAGIPGAVVHCARSPRLPNTSHVGFAGIEGEALLIRLDLAGFAVSTGSACSSGTVEPSKTLLAAGFSPAQALSSLRVSFGIGNRAEEVDAFLAALQRESAELRRLAPEPRRGAKSDPAREARPGPRSDLGPQPPFDPEPPSRRPPRLDMRRTAR
jgi:cysteine desulfurase